MPWVQLKNRSSTASWGVVCAAFLVVSILASPALAGPYRLKADPDLGFECGESLVSGEIACAWKSIENDDGGNVIIQINFTIWNVATGKVAREEGEELEEGDHEEGGTIQFERKLVAEINGYLAKKRFVSAGAKAKITFAKNSLRTKIADQTVTKPLPALSEAEARKCCRPRTGDSLFFSGTKGLLVFVGYQCGQAENERAPCFFAGPDWTEKQQLVFAVRSQKQGVAKPIVVAAKKPQPALDLSGKWTFTQYWKSKGSVTQLGGPTQFTMQRDGSFVAKYQWTRNGKDGSSEWRGDHHGGGVLHMVSTKNPNAAVLLGAGVAKGCMAGVLITSKPTRASLSGIQICRAGSSPDDALISRWNLDLGHQFLAEFGAWLGGQLPAALGRALNAYTSLAGVPRRSKMPVAVQRIFPTPPDAGAAPRKTKAGPGTASVTSAPLPYLSGELEAGATVDAVKNQLPWLVQDKRGDLDYEPDEEDCEGSPNRYSLTVTFDAGVVTGAWIDVSNQTPCWQEFDQAGYEKALTSRFGKPTGACREPKVAGPESECAWKMGDVSVVRTQSLVSEDDPPQTSYTITLPRKAP